MKDKMPTIHFDAGENVAPPEGPCPPRAPGWGYPVMGAVSADELSPKQWVEYFNRQWEMIDAQRPQV